MRTPFRLAGVGDHVGGSWQLVLEELVSPVQGGVIVVTGVGGFGEPA